jgi:hypothetical protein
MMLTSFLQRNKTTSQNPPFNLLVDGGLKNLLSTCEAEEHLQRLALGQLKMFTVFKAILESSVQAEIC